MDKKDLSHYIAKQLTVLFPDRIITEKEILYFLGKTLDRTEYCFSKINNKYFNENSQTFFNHLNSDHYAMFLYFLSNTIWTVQQNIELASKVYYLNKTMNCLDVFYEVELPDIFIFVHPVGTVLGRGTYSDYFVCYQRCTVGGNVELKYPYIGKGVVMYGGSSVIGNCKINDNCLISVGTTVMEKEIPSNTVVFGRYPDISYKHTEKNAIGMYFLK